MYKLYVIQRLDTRLYLKTEENDYCIAITEAINWESKLKAKKVIQNNLFKNIPYSIITIYVQPK